MLNTIDIIFVCVILCVLQGPSDGFSIPRPSPRLDGVSSAAQPSAASSSPWTFPATRLHSSYRRDSSTSLLLLPMISHNQISSSSNNENGGDGILSSDPLLSFPSSDVQAVIPPLEQRPCPSFDNKGKCMLSCFTQPPLTDNDMSVSPSSHNNLRISKTSSHGIRLSNFCLLKGEEAPSILFDKNGVMHTNYFPSRRRQH